MGSCIHNHDVLMCTGFPKGIKPGTNWRYFKICHTFLILTNYCIILFMTVQSFVDKYYF